MMELNEELLEADAEGIKNLGIDVRFVFKILEKCMHKGGVFTPLFVRGLTTSP